MRVLFTTMGAESHLRSLVPVAQAVVAAGHTVRVAAPRSLAPAIAATGLPHVEAGVDMDAPPPQMAAKMAEVLANPSALIAMMRNPDPDMINQMMASPDIVSPMAERLLALGEHWRPDVVVRTAAEQAGALAAEIWQVPHVMVATGAAAVLDRRRVAEVLTPVRAELGLAPDTSERALEPSLTVALMPDPWPVARSRSNNTRYYQHTNISTSSTLDEQYASQDGTRPYVFAALGTQAGRFGDFTSETLSTMIAGLGQVECDAVVAVGADQDPASFADVPSNVTLVKVAPQQQLLGGCDLFITHAGFNSIREAMRAGVPLLATPLFGDQPLNATRCAEFGFGHVLDPAEMTADTVAAAVRTALNTPELRWRAHAWQRRILSAPPLTELVSDLENLTTKVEVAL